MKDLIGIHHVTAITSSAERIFDFFFFCTRIETSEKDGQSRRYKYIPFVFCR
mgnify:CR=1 FL=1